MYNFRSCPAVKKKQLGFWRWYSLNRDMEGNECPGWQWWYWELRGFGGGKEQYLRNYIRFPLVRSAIDKKFMHDGKILPLKVYE